MLPQCGSGGSPSPAAAADAAADARTADDADGGPTADVFVPPPGVDAGLGVGVVDVDDTPCVAMGGTATTVFPARAALPGYRSLQATGGRRVADFASGAGFVTFDLDGMNPASVVANAPVPFGFVASTGNAFLLGGVGSKVEVLPYDASGAAQGQPIPLSDETPTNLALAASATSALVAWSGANGLRGRGLEGAAPAGAGAFDLAITPFVGQLSVSVIDDKNGLFAYAFSGDSGGAIYQTVFGRASTTERAGNPRAVLTGTTPRQVVQLAKTPHGYALLLQAGDPDRFVGLAILDLFGKVVVLRRLLGATSALSVAVQGEELGVTAIRREPQDGGAVLFAPEFRAFDGTGAPLAPWVCLGDLGGTSGVGAALDTDGAGYAALINAGDGSSVLARFDHLGTGTP